MPIWVKVAKVPPTGVLIKALPGFERGPMPGHKYIRRVRIVARGGKLTWRYYYPDDLLAQQRGQAELGPEVEVRPISKFKQDMDVLHQRKDIRSLTVDGITSSLGWKKAPVVHISNPVKVQYHDRIVDTYGGKGASSVEGYGRAIEPDDLHGQPTSVYRSLDLAFDRMPFSIRKRFEGAFSEINLHLADENEKLKAKPDLLGTIDLRSGSITIAVDRAARLAALNPAKQVGGGLALTSALLHEIGHAIAAKAGQERGAGEGNKFRGAEGQTFAEWEAFVTVGPGAPEPGISAYAEANPEDKFAETFAAICMYPQELALRAPNTYEWMRSFIGDSSILPLKEEDAAIRDLYAERAAALEKQDRARAIEIDHEIGQHRSILAISPRDPRLRWWEGKATRLQQMLFDDSERQLRARSNYESVDPISSRDKFYEMNSGGRTIYFRFGPNKAGKVSGWVPASGEAPQMGGFEITKEEGPKGGYLKEIWSDDGLLLTDMTAGFYLKQDKYYDDSPTMQKLITLDRDSGGHGGITKDKENKGAQDANRLGLMLKQIANRVVTAKKDGAALPTDLPVEITEAEFRQRSHTFNYDRWELPAEAEMEKIRHATKASERAELLKKIIDAQPYVETVDRITDDDIAAGRYRAAERGKFRKHEVFMEADPETGQPIPRLGRKLYRLDNPDGTVSVIEASLDRSGDAHKAGHYYLDSPVWRNLITPNDEPVDSAEALTKLCWEARGRRAWVAIRTNSKNAGTTPHYIHCWVEFDGRGTPKLLGDIWKQRFNDPEPRIEDLLHEESKGRPSIPAEEIKHEAPVPPPEAFGVGDRVVLTIRADEVKHGKREPKDIVARVRRRLDNGTFELVGEKHGGASGHTFIRDEQGLRSDARFPLRGLIPKPLQDNPLVFGYQEVDPRTGSVRAETLRVRLPVSEEAAARVMAGLARVGVTEEAPRFQGEAPTFEVDLQQFLRLREGAGTLSLDEIAQQMVRAKADEQQAAIAKANRKEHFVELQDIDPQVFHPPKPDDPEFAQKQAAHDRIAAKFDLEKLELKSEVRGNKFTMPLYQAQGVQKGIDNGGNLLMALDMGMGKTIAALVMSRMLMAMRDPADPTKPHPDRPKRTLAVVPLGTFSGWRDDTAAFANGCTTIGTGGNDLTAAELIEDLKSGNAEHEIVVVGPQYLLTHKDELAPYFDKDTFIITDEAHVGIKAGKNDISRLVSEWGANGKVLLLTGTPITIAPDDALQYIKILSKNEQWGNMTNAQFVNEFLEPSPIPAEFGVRGQGRGPRLQVKASKRAELASVLGQWFTVATPKDVKEKVLPVVHIDESEFAPMQGTQSLLYALKLAALSPKEVEQMRSNMSADENDTGLSDREARASVSAAKQIMNCPAYKPRSDDKFIKATTVTVDARGVESKRRDAFETFNPEYLMDKKARKAFAGKWPSVDEIGAERALIYTAYLSEVVGAGYAEVAGTDIKPEQLKRMRSDGWPRKVDNPDSGAAAIVARGSDEPVAQNAELVDRARRVQRQYALNLQGVREGRDAEGNKIEIKTDPGSALANAAASQNVSIDEARRLLNVRPDAFVHHAIAERNGVQVHEYDAKTGLGKRWFIEEAAGARLIYAAADCDENGVPKERTIEELRPGDPVRVGKKLYTLAPAEPKGNKLPFVRIDVEDVEESDEDEGPSYEYIDRKKVTPIVPSIFEPGRRDEYMQACVAMVVGNAKAEHMGAQLDNFFDTRAGVARDEQLLVFAHNIVEGLHTCTATLRLHGFRDVNEAIEGSRFFDPADAGPSPNGKYYVTYYGNSSTFVGSRDLNLQIFKKVQDSRGQFSDTSLFVNKCDEGRTWFTYPGSPPHPTIKLSQWTPEERTLIKQQFGINAPESYVTGRDKVRSYFYGTPESKRLLHEMVKLSKRVVGKDPEKAAAALTELKDLQAKYTAIATANAKPLGALTDKQRNVFNNCAVLVASDAAQAGVNLGESDNVILYDTLTSPMAERQRIARAARLLPDIIRKELRPIFARLKQQEAKLFQASEKRGPASGAVIGFKFNGQDHGSLPLSQALAMVVAEASHQASVAQDKEVRETWDAIAARARTGITLGVNAAIAALEEMSTTQWPGTDHNVVRFTSYTGGDVMQGTYDKVEIAPGILSRIRDAIEGAWDEETRNAVINAGYGTPHGTIDVADIYVTMRADEILTYLETERPKMAARMRSAPGGSIVNESDITNELVRSLTKEDRAILHTRGLLKPVKRLGVSTVMPVVVDGHVAGWEEQQPVDAERRARAISRARYKTVENIMSDIQNGVTVRSPYDYYTAQARDIANLSRTDIKPGVARA